MLEKCNFHGSFRNRPCVSNSIAECINKGISFDLPNKEVFIFIPQKDDCATLKSCFLTEEDFIFTREYLQRTSSQKKGENFDLTNRDLIMKYKNIGRLILIDRDYKDRKSNDVLFIRSFKSRTKLVCPECLKVTLTK